MFNVCAELENVLPVGTPGSGGGCVCLGIEFSTFLGKIILFYFCLIKAFYRRANISGVQGRLSNISNCIQMQI